MTIANDATAKLFNMVSSSLKAAKNAKGFDGPTSSARRQHRVFDLDHVYCDEARRIAVNIVKPVGAVAAALDPLFVFYR